MGLSSVAHLGVDVIDVEGEIGELDGAGAELNVELVEVDVADDEIAELLLQQELADPLDRPPGQQRLRRPCDVPREHR